VPIVVVLPAPGAAIGDPLLAADELVVWPPRHGELLSRLHRATGSAPLRITQETTLRAGALRLEPGRGAAWVAGSPVSLGPREFRLLAHLVRHPLRVHSRRQLVEVVWPGEPGVRPRAVDVQVRRVRAKLGTEMGGCIRTVRRVGYAFQTPA
jgi:DNA-binding response OmpR family regulator